MRLAYACVAGVILAAFGHVTVPLASAAAAPVPDGYRAIPVETAPAIAGVRVSLGGGTTVTDKHGRGRVLVPSSSSNPNRVGGTGLGDLFATTRRSLKVTEVRLHDGGRASFARFYGGNTLTLLFDTFYTFRPAFVAIDGRPVDPSIVQSYTLKSRHGVRVTVDGAKPVELQASRVVSLDEGLVSKEIEWAVERVMVNGTNVVNRGQQRFSPSGLIAAFPVQLLFYPARFTSEDAIFGFHVGSAITLRHPDGSVHKHPFARDGTVTIPLLPRGDYEVDVDGPGFTPARPVALSRAQVVDLKVISFLDVAVIGIGLAALLTGLVVARRPHLRSPARVRAQVAGLAPALRQATARRGEHGVDAPAPNAHPANLDLDRSIAPQQPREQVAESQ